MGNAAVLNMKGESVTQKEKKKRERICWIEQRPRPDWFVQCKGTDGKTWWFLRLAITGLRTRIYGPFATRHRALLFLDRIISGDSVTAGLSEGVMEADNRLSDYAIRERRFENRCGNYPIVENDLYLQASTAEPTNGRAE